MYYFTSFSAVKNVRKYGLVSPPKKIELFYNFYFLKNWRGIKPNFRTTKNLFLQISVFLIESE